MNDIPAYDWRIISAGVRDKDELRRLRFAYVIGFEAARSKSISAIHGVKAPPSNPPEMMEEGEMMEGEQHESLSGRPRTITQTCGTGMCVLDQAIPPNAKLYRISMGTTDWEIGFVTHSGPISVMRSLIRDPIVSPNGVAKRFSFASGPKVVEFFEEIPRWLAEVASNSPPQTEKDNVGQA